MRQYIGARYMPKFMGLHNLTTDYEALSVVDNGEGTTYICNQPTPAGTPLSNSNYWKNYGSTSGAIINLQDQIDDIKNNIIPNINSDIDTVEGNLSGEVTARTNADTNLQGQINNLSNTLSAEITRSTAADSSEESARISADNNLQTQINQIVAPSGEAPSAAEVENARIGADGVTYSTLGEAIRTNDTNLARNILNVRFNSKVVIDDWMSGRYVYYADGHVGYQADYSCSPMFTVNPGAVYTLSGGENLQYAFYDENGTYISGDIDSNRIFTISGEKAYMRISSKTSALSTLEITYTYDPHIIDLISDAFNSDTIVWYDGYYRNYNTGNLSANADWCYSNFITVLPGELVSCGWDNTHITFADKNFAYISGELYHNVVKAPNNAVYMCISIPIANKPNISLNRKVDKIILSENTYSTISRAFNEAQSYLLPIYVIGGTWDVSDLYAGIGLQLYSDLIGVGNPVFIADPDTYNSEFSIINLKATTKNKIIRVEGITFDSNNMRYCVHDEMGGTTTDSGEHGYTHIYKNCTFISRENVYRPVGIGVGDDGIINIENCIFESKASTPPLNLLDIHCGYQGQNSHSDAFVKDCIFKNGTCSFTEVGEYDYSSDKNTFVAENNYVSQAPYVTRTNNKQIDFYKWNNEIAI